jgi:transposase
MVQDSSNTTDERNAAIYVAVVDGATYGDLAERYGISKVRVQKAYARERTNAWEARRRGETSHLGRPIPADV